MMWVATADGFRAAGETRNAVFTETARILARRGVNVEGVALVRSDSGRGWDVWTPRRGVVANVHPTADRIYYESSKAWDDVPAPAPESGVSP